MITLAFAQIVYFLGVSLKPTAATTGSTSAAADFAGLFDLRDKVAFYWLCFALLCASLWFCGRFAHSRFGIVLRGAESTSCA